MKTIEILDGNKLKKLLESVGHLIFMTSGQCLVFDKNEDQIGDLQGEFVNGETNIPLLREIAKHADRLTIGKWREWMQDVSKDDFFKITNIATESIVVNTKSDSTAIEPDKSKWIPASERLPEIDTSDKWNNEHQISKDVVCYSKEWGRRFGRYYYLSGFWTVDGVTSSNGVNVEYWMDVDYPENK